MILIPSAFFEVLFEPVTEAIKSCLKWTAYVVLYLLSVAAIVFSVIAFFVILMGITSDFGVH